MVVVDYQPSYGEIRTDSAVYMMYGQHNGLRATEAIVGGQLWRFDPVEVLKALPEARSKKAMKACAAWMTLRKQGMSLGFINLPTAYWSTKGTRMSTPPRIRPL